MTQSTLSLMAAATLVSVALGIGWVQRRAHACPVHSAAAGRAAVVLAWLCAAGAAGLVTLGVWGG